MSENVVTLVNRWIALLDAAEHLRQTADPRDPCAMKRVGMAIDSLFTFEHTLTDTQRARARRALWLRDKAEPLPPDTTEWQRCRCRRCLLSRRLGRVSQAPSTLPASVHIPAPVQESLPLPHTEASQGEPVPCIS
jgi:hypothetical protein